MSYKSDTVLDKLRYAESMLLMPWSIAEALADPEYGDSFLINSEHSDHFRTIMIYFDGIS